MVVLVNTKDEEIGMMEKMEAHQKGLLHRAFSIFVFNNQQHLLLQKRALNKYHSPGLWTNTCCSHPRPNENVLDAAHRRLQEEMGFDCTLTSQFSFIYKASFDNELIEHELDHVFFGHFQEFPKINTTEVADFRYVSIEEINEELKMSPNLYTEWFKICWQQVQAKINNI